MGIYQRKTDLGHVYKSAIGYRYGWYYRNFYGITKHQRNKPKR